MYEVKGAGDYVESANTVLLMELAKQTREQMGNSEHRAPRIGFYTSARLKIHRLNYSL